MQGQVLGSDCRSRRRYGIRKCHLHCMFCQSGIGDRRISNKSTVREILQSLDSGTQDSCELVGPGLGHQPRRRCEWHCMFSFQSHYASVFVRLTSLYRMRPKKSSLLSTRPTQTTRLPLSDCPGKLQRTRHLFHRLISMRSPSGKPYLHSPMIFRPPLPSRAPNRLLRMS